MTTPASPSIVITPEIVAEHGLTPREYESILATLGRTPTITELGVYSVMWSEHCSYKHSRPHLVTLPTRGPRVVQGPGENAGAIDIGEGLVCVFKIESHNHPSAVEPFQGAATGVGGILRDIFAMGARPIALLDALRFGPPDEDRNRHIIEGVIAGIAEYGNCVGVPTVAGEFTIDPCYSDNCLVNVMAIGLAPRERILSARARGVGQLLVYYGNSTGRDGIHGATFASTDLTEETAASRSCVQVGDPFMEKKILEATLELGAAGLFVALQDMGAAGLTCSSTEMGDKGGLGIRLNLDRVPQRAARLTAYEILLSESQERMLGVVAPENLDRVSEILAKWDLEAHVVGETTDTRRFVVEHLGAVQCDVPLESICSKVPPPDPVVPVPAPAPAMDWRAAVRASGLNKSAAWADLLTRVLATPHYASKRWIYSQYDHQVQTNTVVRPGEAGAAVLRIEGHPGFLATTVDGNGAWCALDPREGTRCVVAESARNLVAAGARPLAVTNNLNFGNPRTPAIAWQFAEAVRGLGEACRAFDTPVTGGNVSLYNESPRRAVYPTPVIGMVGLVERAEHITPSGFPSPGLRIYHVGPAPNHAGGSGILRTLAGELVGPALRIDLDLESRTHAFMLEAIAAGHIRSAIDIADGGLILALAEAALLSRDAVGAWIDLPRLRTGPEELVAFLLSEEPSRFVVSVDPAAAQPLESLAATKGISLTPLGETVTGRLAISPLLDHPLPELRAAWETHP